MSIPSGCAVVLSVPDDPLAISFVLDAGSGIPDDASVVMAHLSPIHCVEEESLCPPPHPTVRQLLSVGELHHVHGDPSKNQYNGDVSSITSIIKDKQA